MRNCAECGYLCPESWDACLRCHAPLAVASTTPAPMPFVAPSSMFAGPVQEPVPFVPMEAQPFWRQPAVPLVATALGFLLVLLSAISLPWMRVGGFFHAELSFREVSDVLSSRNAFSRLALDIGPLLLLADLVVVGWRVGTAGRIGREAAWAPIGIACLVLDVANEIHGLSVGVKEMANLGDTGGLFAIDAAVGPGPWICLLGCSLLVAGAFLGPAAQHR